MEQGDDGDRFRLVLQPVQLLHPGALQVIGQTVVDVDAVVAQAARVGAVVMGGGGGGEKVALVLQVVQQGGRTLPVDVGLIDLKELFFGGHDAKPRSSIKIFSIVPHFAEVDNRREAYIIVLLTKKECGGFSS